MGQEIKAGLDTIITNTANITGSNVGWADGMTEISEALKSSNNDLGSAALIDAGTDANEVLQLNASGKVPVANLPTATAGGTGNANLIPQLNSLGLLASTMIPGGSSGGGSGGIKYIWWYTDVNSFGQSYSSETNRQYNYTWSPRDKDNNLVECSTILILATGGGGSGAPGPAATVNGVNGVDAKKGGGGGAGATVMAIRTGITSNDTRSIKVGRGGAAKAKSASASTTYDGADSLFAEIRAGGGQQGFETITGAGNQGVGGAGGTWSAGDAQYGFGINGGQGGNGIIDKFGGGHGGSSFWAGGFAADYGSDATRNDAWGAGGGGASGSSRTGPAFNFNADHPGFAGNDGIVVVIGW